MQKEYSKFKEKITENKIIVLVLIISGFYWIIESIMDTFIFQSYANFLNSLFFPGIHETWMRILIFSFFIFIGLFSQSIITKRKKTEQENRELKEFYKNVLDSILSGVWITDKDDVIYYSNKAMQKIVDLEENKFIGIHALKDFQEDTLKNFKPYYLQAKDTSNPIFYEDVPVLTPRGTSSYQSGWIIPIIKNKIFDGMICTVEDITDRKRAKQQIVDLARFPSENPNPVLRAFKNRLIYINKRGRDLFQIDEGDAIPDFLNEKIQESLKKNSIEEIEEELENKVYSLAITPIKESGYVNIYGMDITERKKAENLIIEEYQKLTELNQIRKDLITRVSHELKTPLNAIYGASQRLFEYLEKNFNPVLYNYAEIINRGGKRLKKLISNIIDTAKLDDNKLVIRKQKEDLVGIIKECVEDLIYLANERVVFLDVDLPEKIFFEIDKIRIEQVITNILSNAIKNTLSRGTIFIKLQEDDKNIDISIKDTGIGVTIEERKQLFERFGKIERHGKGLGVDIEGSGLGLYISKELVTLHGGEILVESDGRNKGAKFTIRLNKNHSEHQN